MHTMDTLSLLSVVVLRIGLGVLAVSVATWLAARVVRSANVKGSVGEIFSESNKKSWGRVGSAFALLNGCGWVWWLVTHGHSNELPSLAGLTAFILALYGASALKQYGIAAKSAAVNPQDKPPVG